MKLALVTPWFGRELKGGAEQQAWQIATRLAERGHAIEVLTTCCRSHQDDWTTNHLRAGLFRETERFHVRRFPVEQRDRAALDLACGKLLRIKPEALRPGISPVSAEDAEVFVHTLIKSPRLLNFVEDHRADYDRLLFIPYLYGPVLDGVRCAAEKAALQPCLHDEAYAYLPQVAEAFLHAGLLLFNSAGEIELAAKLFGPGIFPKSILVGEGIETPSEISATNNDGNSDRRATQTEKYLLYLGRKDVGKNVDLLLRAFGRFRAVRPNSRLRLLLAGHGSLGIALPDSARDLGAVSEQRKEELLRECAALVQPSTNESFSRVMMEAWLHGKPVGVHARCLATATAVREANGGWTPDCEADWARWFVELDRTPEEKLAQLGQNGRQYARRIANWDLVIDRYEEALQPRPQGASRSIRHATEINQVLPNLSHGDAISNFALLIRDALRNIGFRSRIFVLYLDPRMANECEVFSPPALVASNAIIYHHSIGSSLTAAVVDHAGPKCLIYHNITPAEFFDADRLEFAQLLRQGRQGLYNLAPRFPLAYGVSNYNAQELRAAGFRNPQVLPLCVDPATWAISSDPMLMHSLQDGRTNLLFVGRISPNKKQDDLVRGFASYLALDATARLHLVGAADSGDPYAARLRETIAKLGLNDSVTLPGNVSASQLQAYYRTANLFWSMSEHEGFGVPLIEAMWFDVPVLAFRSSAVPETLGHAAMMFSNKNDLPEIAALAHLLVTDVDLRAKIISRQQKRRQEFLPKQVLPKIAQLAERLLAEPAAQ